MGAGEADPGGRSRASSPNCKLASVGQVASPCSCSPVVSLGHKQPGACSQLPKPHCLSSSASQGFTQGGSAPNPPPRLAAEAPIPRLIQPGVPYPWNSLTALPPSAQCLVGTKDGDFGAPIGLPIGQAQHSLAAHAVNSACRCNANSHRCCPASVSRHNNGWPALLIRCCTSWQETLWGC